MFSRDFIKNKFIEKHGEPDNNEFFDEYLNLILFNVLNTELTSSELYYTEFHHILPRSTFPEFKQDEWNIVKLEYIDHILAHELLFCSYNLRQYQKPLNYMNGKQGISKNKEMLSKASKRGWINLKNNTIVYEQWVKKRSEYMSKLTSEEQCRRVKLFWDNITDEEYNKRIEDSKKLWTEDKRKEWGEFQKEYCKNNEGYASKRSQKRWDTITDEKRESFNKRMKEVNNQEDKKKKAGKKIKEKWLDDDYLEKMRNRKVNKNSYKLIKPNGDELFEYGLQEIVKKYNFNITLLRRFLDTDLPVTCDNHKLINREKTKNTLGWKFFKINK
jgi:hypothetical protein